MTHWPALERAAQLVQQRLTVLDGEHCEILTPAAEAPSARHQLAATRALRAMIGFTPIAG